MPVLIVTDGGTMRNLAIVFTHLLTTIAKLMRPGVLAESLLLKHQLGILNRGHKWELKRRKSELHLFRRIAQTTLFAFDLDLHSFRLLTTGKLTPDEL